jgi:hypothetical protein
VDTQSDSGNSVNYIRCDPYKRSTLVPGAPGDDEYAYNEYWATQTAPDAPADIAPADIADAVRAGTATRAMVDACPFGVLRVLREAKPTIACINLGFYHGIGADAEPLSYGDTVADAVWNYMHEGRQS